MIDTEKPYANTELTYLRIGPAELLIQLPNYGYCPTSLNNTTIDLDCMKQLPQRDAEGNRYADILRQDWIYRYLQQETLAGSIFLTISVHAKQHSGNFGVIQDLSKHLITQVKKSEEFAQELKRENAQWTGGTYNPAPCYQFPQSASDFKSEVLFGHTLFSTRIGGTGIDILPFDYYLPVRHDAFIHFVLSPSGFPAEDFANPEARDTFLQSLTDDFMRRIQITSDHPVSA